MKYLIIFLSVFFISQSANAEDFAYSKEWLSLLHYQKGFFGGYESSVESQDFFISNQGRNNPQAEFNASLELFEKGEDIEKICRFPARYKLMKNNNITDKTYPKCEDYEKFITDLQPSGVTLLFTNAYMSNPSSLFGHTLLRIDTSRQGTQQLAHGANYGAFMNEDAGAFFAIYGIAGVYYGGWTVKPYYQIIETYNNIENRDIWEYNLNLSEQEVEMFVAHLWEIGPSRSRYYFFTKNCSYWIMETLDAIRPSLNLASKFTMQTIPLDTVKAVYNSDDLVASINFRPSRQNQIIHKFRNMNDEQKKSLYKIIEEQDYQMSGLVDEQQKAEVVETAALHLWYRFKKEDIEVSEYRKQNFKNLLERNKLRKVKASEKLQGKNPVEAHGSKRVTIGVGSRNGESFQEISYRPAYHSLTDNGYGMLKGAEINFLNLQFRHYDKSKKTVLSRFDLAEVKSLSPVNRLFMPSSIEFGANIVRELNPQSQSEGYALNLRARGGLTFEINDSLWVYGLNSLYGSYGGFLPHNQYVAAGFAIGGLLDFEYFRLLAEAEKVFASTWFGDKIKYRIEAAVPISTNWAVAAEYRFDDNSKGRNSEEFMSSLRFYF